MSEQETTDIIPKIIVGFIFSLIILWYFTYRIIGIFTSIIFNSDPSLFSGVTLPISFVLSVSICISLIKVTVDLEKSKGNKEFSIVAKDPNRIDDIEDYRVGSFFTGLTLSIVGAFLLSLPLSLIGCIQFISKEKSAEMLLKQLSEGYWVYYCLCFVISLIGIFFVIPSLRKWHWTKKQFR